MDNVRGYVWRNQNGHDYAIFYITVSILTRCTIQAMTNQCLKRLMEML